MSSALIFLCMMTSSTTRFLAAAIPSAVSRLALLQRPWVIVYFSSRTPIISAKASSDTDRSARRTRSSLVSWVSAVQDREVMLPDVVAGEHVGRAGDISERLQGFSRGPAHPLLVFVRIVRVEEEVSHYLVPNRAPGDGCNLRRAATVVPI